jgi:hypothetical protein
MRLALCAGTVVSLEVGAVCGLLLLTARVAAARSAFMGAGIPQKHGGEAFLGLDQVVLLSGDRAPAVTDLTLPVNARRTLGVTRVYNSPIHPHVDDNSADVAECSSGGVGWRLHFARVNNESPAVNGGTIIGLGDGCRQPLFITTAHPEGWMPASFGVSHNTPRTLQAPNGFVRTPAMWHQPDGLVGPARCITARRDPHQQRSCASRRVWV